MPHGYIKSALEQHHIDCYGWALYCCNRDREMASEVLQMAYLKILEKKHTFRGTSNFRTWAFAIIRNTATDVKRKQKKKLGLIKNENNVPETEYEIMKEFEFDVRLRQLFFEDALNQLSERQRQIMQLVFYHDLSLNQSAEILKISQGSARKHYDRAKKFLAGWFRKKGFEDFK
jgi:RNA polymerase sigma factor (sigma-70 family)